MILPLAQVPQMVREARQQKPLMRTVMIFDFFSQKVWGPRAPVGFLAAICLIDLAALFLIPEPPEPFPRFFC